MKLIFLLPLSLFALQAVSAFYRPGHSFSGSLLLQYLSWNEVPNEVYLGLLSGNQGVERTQLINGSCFINEPHEFERCKYYSDCCAMTPAIADFTWWTNARILSRISSWESAVRGQRSQVSPQRVKFSNERHYRPLTANTNSFVQLPIC